MLNPALIKPSPRSADTCPVRFEDEEPFAAAFLKHRRQVKLGRRLLILGLLLTAAWLRSIYFADEVQWLGREQQVGMAVGEGRVELVANNERLPYNTWQVATNERLRAAPHFGFSLEHTTKLSLAVPLWALAIPVGILGLYKSHRRHWSPFFA